MDFPTRQGEKATLPIEVYDSLSIKPVEVYKARDYLLVYKSEDDIRNIEIDRAVFDEINLDPGGVIITAPGKESDFVSRYFTPQSTILEDPVTGSAHCTLAPYWHARTGKNTMFAKQLSQRGGSMHCIMADGRILLKGKAVTYSKGEISIPKI
jgi:predicted PhzF superfamily epimerase YddE/YHI9